MIRLLRMATIGIASVIFGFIVCPTLSAFDWSVEQRAGTGTYQVVVGVDEMPVILSPEEGLWSVAADWQEGAPTNWIHVYATKKAVVGDVTVLSGETLLKGGTLRFRDCYEPERGMLRCVRRYEYSGPTLENISFSVRWTIPGERLQAFLPGIVYYGNPSGTRHTPGRVPTYEGRPGEFAVFEEHRYPMPFACLENAENLTAAAIHVIPSPVRRGSVFDQWNSMGVRAVSESSSELSLHTGWIGFNSQNSVAKALQSGPMSYPQATMTLTDGTVIEKTFYLDAWRIAAQGQGFRHPIGQSIDLFEPFSVDGLPSRDAILKSKFEFARSRWIENEHCAGFRMYPDTVKMNHIVMGWCGQAAACGYAFSVLENRIVALYPEEEQPEIRTWIAGAVQKSLDHLTTASHNETGFSVLYDIAGNQWHGSGDPVSCGQAMFHFVKAIEHNRKTNRYDASHWEAFFRQACDVQAKRILADSWRPFSTADGFMIAPLAIGARLFENETWLAAARKAADHYIERHLLMEEPYWGGTLDACGEDKEGAWAAFQGFFYLHQATEEQKYLHAASHAADCSLSYTAVWDIPLPPGRLADRDFRTRGWTVVSPQNQHLDLYAVTMTPEIEQLGVTTGNEPYRKLSEVMFRSCGQLIDPFGSQGEQIQQTNFAQHGEMSDVLALRGGYSEGWTVFWLTAHFLSAEARMNE